MRRLVFTFLLAFTLILSACGSANEEYRYDEINDSIEMDPLETALALIEEGAYR